MKRTQYEAPFQKSRAYAPAVVTEGGRTVWLAGLLAPKDEDGMSLAGDFAGQVRCIFRKMSVQIEEVGGGIGEGVLAGAAVEDADDSVLRSVDVTAENILVKYDWFTC